MWVRVATTLGLRQPRQPARCCRGGARCYRTPRAVRWAREADRRGWVWRGWSGMAWCGVVLRAVGCAGGVVAQGLAVGALGCQGRAEVVLVQSSSAAAPPNRCVRAPPLGSAARRPRAAVRVKARLRELRLGAHASTGGSTPRGGEGAGSRVPRARRQGDRREGARPRARALSLRAAAAAPRGRASRSL